MTEQKKNYIRINGELLEVSSEIYEAYYKGKRKEKYFEQDLKRERIVIDKKTGNRIEIPGHEDSYERLLEAEQQFCDASEGIEEAVIRTIMLESLDKALQTLSEQEKHIIYGLFYQEKSVTQLASELGIPRTTIHSQKQKILNKLKKLL